MTGVHWDGDNVGSVDASDLSLPPGYWPRVIHMRVGNRLVPFADPERVDRAGVLVRVVYFSGTHTLLVNND